MGYPILNYYSVQQQQHLLPKGLKRIQKEVIAVISPLLLQLSLRRTTEVWFPVQEVTRDNCYYLTSWKASPSPYNWQDATSIQYQYPFKCKYFVYSGGAPSYTKLVFRQSIQMMGNKFNRKCLSAVLYNSADRWNWMSTVKYNERWMLKTPISPYPPRNMYVFPRIQAPLVSWDLNWHKLKLDLN